MSSLATTTATATAKTATTTTTVKNNNNSIVATRERRRRRQEIQDGGAMSKAPTSPRGACIHTFRCRRRQNKTNNYLKTTAAVACRNGYAIFVSTLLFFALGNVVLGKGADL